MGLVLRTLMSTNPTLLTKSKLLSVAALVQALSIPCLKRCNHLATLPHSPCPQHTALQSPSLLLRSIYHSVNPRIQSGQSNYRKRPTVPPNQTPQHGVQAPLSPPPSSHPPLLSTSTALCYSSNKPHVFTCLGSGYSWNAIPYFSVLNTYSSFKAHLKYHPSLNFS